MEPADIVVPVDSLLLGLHMLGAAVFAATGALVAAQLRQNLVTFGFFALITGVGGGTVRDLLIGAPVFWVHDPGAAIMCCVAAVLVWLTPQKWWSPKALDWLDAVGLAAYAVFGTAKAMSYGISPFIAALMGIMTACVGGIMRDLLAGQPSILLRPEIYVTAAALSAGLYPLLLWQGVASPVAGIIAALAGFGLRAMAMVKGWALPAYAKGEGR
ncbi:MAG: trimeric intracellular cation channel family protein [Sphingobium sp.]|nr:trimeric intracellular cation channel family protein [Sphingobium sp.]